MIGMTQTISRTSAATAARMRASEDKMAEKLRERGWMCFRTGSPDTVLGAPEKRAGMQLYAINGLREVYRVAGFTGANEPILQGSTPDRDFVGLQSYVYAVGKP